MVKQSKHTTLRDILLGLLVTLGISASGGKYLEPNLVTDNTAPNTTLVAINREVAERTRAQLVDYLVTHNDFWVPAHPLGISVTERGSVPRATHELAREAMRFLLRLEGNPYLQTNIDRDIFELLRDFEEDGWQNDNPTIILRDDQNVRMSHNCALDVFTLSHKEMTMEFLAATIWHELAHRIVCQRATERSVAEEVAGREPYQLHSTPWDSEEYAYAAQIRVLAAMQHQNLLPDTISATGHSDHNSLILSEEAHDAILQNDFERWYKMRFEDLFEER